MMTRRRLLAATVLAALFVAAPAHAQERLKVVATFSILGDFVRIVGGDRVAVETLVGPNSNAHVYAPSPTDAKQVADAKLVIVNGLGFEGWLERLIKASGSKAPVVVATKGIKPRERAGDRHDHDHGRRSARLAIGRRREDLCRQYPRCVDRRRSCRQGHLCRQCHGLSRQARRARTGGARGDRQSSRRSPPRDHQPQRLRLFPERSRVELTAPQGVSTESKASARRSPPSSLRSRSRRSRRCSWKT